MKRKGVFTLAFALAGFVSSAYAANLIGNPSFETKDSTNPALAAGWQPYGPGYERKLDSTAYNGQAIARVVPNASALSGLWQRVTRNQPAPGKAILITVRVRTFDVPDDPTDTWTGTIYAEIHRTDGTVDYSASSARTKNVGTSAGWRRIGFNTSSRGVTKPITYLDIFLVMGKVSTGSVWFDQASAEEYENRRGIVTVASDDGGSTTYHVMFPVLQAHGWPLVTAVVTSYLSTATNPDPGHMTVPQLHTLVSHGWEIMSHSVDHAHMTTLTPEAAEAEFRDSRQFLLANGFNVRNFAWPYGEYNQSLVELGHKYFGSFRGVERGANPPGVYPDDVRILEVDTITPLSEVFGTIDRVKTQPIWLILLFHDIRDTGDDIYHTTPAVFRQIMDHLATANVPVVTYQRGLELFTSLTPMNAASPAWSLYE